MKKLIVVFLLFLFCFPVINSYAEDVNFGFSLGTIWTYYDISADKFNVDADLFHFNWLLHDKFIIGVNLARAIGSPDNHNTQVILLPVELGFIPLSYNLNANHQLCLSINGKMGWHFAYRNEDLISNQFYGSIGTQLFLQFREPGSQIPYSRYLSLFVEYNTLQEFKVGIGVDLSLILLGIFLWGAL
ncbi:MAG: hypothetical protein LBI28_12265 [Treponema sp.]|jgi:hypothetical protein|nr:hypothetical protein [Treponema sp.]